MILPKVTLSHGKLCAYESNNFERFSKVMLTGLVSDAYWLTGLLLAWSKSFENVPVKPWQYQDTVRALQSNDCLFLSLRCVKSNR